MKRCPATTVERINGEPVVRQCSRLADHELVNGDTMHAWLRPGHRVLWPVKP